MDKGSKVGDINTILHPWEIKSDEKIIVEVKIKVDSSTDPLAVAVRIANGRNVEYLTLLKNSISLQFADLSHSMNTSDDFHLYRIEIKGEDLRVYVDGILKLNANGKFVTPVTNKRGQIGGKLPYYLDKLNKCGVGIGSFSGPGKSSARYKFVRYNVNKLVIRDLALEINY